MPDRHEQQPYSYTEDDAPYYSRRRYQGGVAERREPRRGRVSEDGHVGDERYRNEGREHDRYHRQSRRQNYDDDYTETRSNIVQRQRPLTNVHRDESGRNHDDYRSEYGESYDYQYREEEDALPMNSFQPSDGWCPREDDGEQEEPMRPLERMVSTANGQNSSPNSREQLNTVQTELLPLRQRKRIYKLTGRLMVPSGAKQLTTVQEKLRESLSDVLKVIRSFIPLQRTLHAIDNQYGSDVYSYFRFIIWLMTINLIGFGVLFAFALAPSILYQETGDGSAAPAFRTGNEAFLAVDILTGNGSLASSLFHYGFYQSDESSAHISNYDRSLAYIFATAGAYLVPLIAITYSVTQSYGKVMTSSSAVDQASYSEAVFSRWEHGIMSPSAIKQTRSRIRTKLAEMLAQFKRQRVSRRGMHATRVIVNLTVAALIGGICAGLWFAFDTLQNQVADGEYQVEKELAPIIAITAANLFFPFLLTQVTKLEKSATYETELALSTSKGILLNVATVAIMFFYWMIEESGQTLDIIGDGDEKNCETKRSGCWESQLSMKFYQLAVMNVIFEWGLVVLGAIVLVMTRLIGSGSRFQLTFRSDLLTQRAMYLQTLIWLGMFYSPMITPLALFSFALAFLRDLVLVRYTNLFRSAPRGGSTESTQVAYSSALLLNFVLCAGVVAFSVNLMLPSTDCGPLRTICPVPDMAMAAVSRIRDDDIWAFEFLDLLLTPTVLIYLILLLIVLIYYFNMKANAMKELLPTLQRHLAREAKAVSNYYARLTEL